MYDSMGPEIGHKFECQGHNIGVRWYLFDLYNVYRWNIKVATLSIVQLSRFS